MIKAYFRLVSAALTAAALLAGCAKEKVNEQAATEPAVQAEGSRTIAVSFAPQTKTALGEDGLTPEFKAYEDTIKVAKKDGSASPEDCPVYIENEVAVIHTDLEGDLVAVYPSSAASIDGNVINGVRVPSKQTGKFADANICSATILAGSQSATFKNETAILKFYVDKSIGVKSITIGNKENIADNSSIIKIDETDESSILSEITKETSNERICYVAVLAGIHSALQFTSETSTQSAPVQKQLQPVTLLPGTMYNVFLPYYIQVGDQKWGYCNIGAFLPEEPGKYFAWGSIEGFKYHYEPEWQFDNAYEFSWENCPYIVSYEGDSDQDYTFSKYVIHQKFWGGTGSMDNKQTLEPEDDAAHVAWQDQWRMPKKAELEQLAKLQASSIYGKYISVDDKLILPVTGHGVAEALTQYDCDGVYWSSDLSESEYLGSYAYSLSFHIVSQEINEQVSTTQRSNGYPIRPIYGDPVPDTPTDAIGEFTVGMDSEKPIKVRFSKGNLQATYDGKIYNWGFAEHQYDYIGEASGNVSIDNPQAGDVVDLFGWVGQSSSFTGAAGYGISNDENDSDYSNDVNDVLKSDWGNTIDDKGTWRTLSKSEWEYLLLTREMPNNGARFQDRTSGLTLRDEKGEDATGYGIVLFPDGYTNQETWTNTYKDWEEFASNGLVFLPTAGRRRGNGDVEYSGQNQHCYYWTSTHEPTMVSNAYYLWIYSSSTPFSDDFCCSTGNAVRLVTNSTTNN